VLRALGLGDLLAGVPALRALRRALVAEDPDAELVLAAPVALAPLVALAGVADRLLPTPDLGPVDWTGPPPDLAVDLHGNGPASRDPLRALGPGRLLAFADPDAPAWRADEPERERWCRLLTEGLGIPADPADLEIRRPAAAGPAGTGPAVVHPGAAFPSRRWPADRYAEVAAALAADGPVVVTGGLDELPLVEEVRRRAQLPAVADLAGTTDLAGLAAVVASARVVVCGDTGVAHLASAFGTPSVVLFGPTPPALWGPPPGPHRALWHGEGLERGDPHGRTPDPRLLRISVDEVLAAVAALGA
jgi:ADP-heptose:LPS heptosyltransferase